jgi:hypothetical protein
MTRWPPWLSVRGQIGSSGERRASYDLLLRTEELPEAGWDVRFERSWRAGSSGRGRKYEETRRAFKAGLFAVARGFQKDQVRDLVFSGAPFVSAEDAHIFMPKWYRRDAITRRVKGERVILNPQVTDLSDVLMLELYTSLARSKTMVVFGRVAHVVMSATLTTRDEDDSCDDVAMFASLQARKIRQQLKIGW